MKYLSTKTFFFVATLLLFSINASAQSVTYLDENYKPANAENYTYKRVLKYKEPVINLNLGTGYYGGITANPTPSGMHICSLIDYYNTGEPALVSNVLTLNLNCSQWVFHGTAVYYFRSGAIKRKEPWKAGKLQGTVITYNTDGTEKKREEYENGNLIEANKFSVSADNPLVGTWKYVKYSGGINSPYLKIPPSVALALTITFSQNGIVEIVVQNPYSSSTEKRNWKYTPQSSSLGVIEEYLGDDLFERVSVRWINSNQFEYTVTFHQNANLVGNQFIFIRQ